MPLQDMPQKFSSMQFVQMVNPHFRHCQQKGGVAPQQSQGRALARRRFSRYDDLRPDVPLMSILILSRKYENFKNGHGAP
jgi:hypothetical protein